MTADAYPLGIDSTDFPSKVNAITMSSWDIFAVISDGIFEARNPQDEEFASERVIDVIIKNSHLSANAIVNALRQSIITFTKNAPAEDDRTIIIIKCA